MGESKMQLKRQATSADYTHIEQLGLKMAAQASEQRISAMTDFPLMCREWRLLEGISEAHSYDVFRAWPVICGRVHRLRLMLHWLSANFLDLPGAAYVLVAMRDAAELREKNAAYGESWKRRGGAGAFMMLARKWDRIDNILAPTGGGSHMRLLRSNPGDVLDDIGDLRRYLLLVEDEATRNYEKHRLAQEPQKTNRAALLHALEAGYKAHEAGANLEAARDALLAELDGSAPGASYVDQG
jgi:hypothetical protein